MSPTIGVFHTNYWAVSDTNAAPIRVSNGGYPAWQAGVIAPSLLGAIGAWLDARWALVRWHWRLARRVHRLSPESKALLVRVVDTMESPLYVHAQAAVRQTAHTLGLGKEPIWKDIGRYMKQEPGRIENVYRHLHARRRLTELAGSTLANPTTNLLTELAYQGFTITRR